MTRKPKTQNRNIKRKSILINIAYFLCQLKVVKHEGFDCLFFDLILLSEKREGLCSILMFSCNKIETINTDNDTANININLTAVTGTLATGIECSQLTVFFASLDLPNMSNNTNQKYHEKLFPTVSKDIKELMIEAGKEESKMALKCGVMFSVGYKNIFVMEMLVFN
ncbi:hypothetical protein FQA39_LY08923 [Lamprigera yunnana]|nr:hypothetical protein FQA39_LY08923 [Lamprigera yunnana]